MCASVSDGFGRKPFLISPAAISRLQKVHSYGRESIALRTDTREADLCERPLICLHVVSCQSSHCHLSQTSCDFGKTSKDSQRDSMCVHHSLRCIDTYGCHPREHLKTLGLKSCRRSKHGMLIRILMVHRSNLLTLISSADGLL